MDDVIACPQTAAVYVYVVGDTAIAGGGIPDAGQVMVANWSSCGELASDMVMLVVSTPLVRPVTAKPWPEAVSTVGVIDAPGRGDEKFTLYGGVPPVTTKFDVWLTHVVAK